MQLNTSVHMDSSQCPQGATAYLTFTTQLLVLAAVLTLWRCYVNAIHGQINNDCVVPYGPICGTNNQIYKNLCTFWEAQKYDLNLNSIECGTEPDINLQNLKKNKFKSNKGRDSKNKKTL